MLTYAQVAGGQLTYSNWVQGIAKGRTVVSRNGRSEFVDLKVNTTNGPGDEIKLTGGGNVQVSVQWTATQSLSGTLELVRNGVVIASQTGTAASGTPVTLSTAVNFTNSGWLCARRMGSNGHTVHTAAVFVTVDQKPVRASAADAQFYVQWMDNLLQNTSPGGVWNSYFPTTLAAAQARYSSARSIYQQIATEAGPLLPPANVMIGNGSDGAYVDPIWGGGAWINAARFQASSNVTVATIRAKVAAIAGHYKCAIYSDSGGSPSALLRGTAEVSNPADGWQAFPLTSSLALTSGSFYWLAIWSDDASAGVYYSDSGAPLRWGQYSYGAWPSPDRDLRRSQSQLLHLWHRTNREPDLDSGNSSKSHGPDRRIAAIHGHGNIFRREHAEYDQPGDVEFVGDVSGNHYDQRTGHCRFCRDNHHLGGAVRREWQHRADGAGLAGDYHNRLAAWRNDGRGLHGNAGSKWRNPCVHLVAHEWVTAARLDSHCSERSHQRDADRSGDVQLHGASERCQQSHPDGDQVPEHHGRAKPYLDRGDSGVAYVRRRGHTAIHGDRNLFRRQHPKRDQPGNVGFVEHGGGGGQRQRSCHGSLGGHHNHRGGPGRHYGEHDRDHPGASSGAGGLSLGGQRALG